MAREAALETRPEPDRLANLPHPRETTPLIGHDKAVEQFAGAYASGRMPGAWLLSGPKGVGKATFAYHAARALLRDQAGTTDDIVSVRHDGVFDRVMAQGHGNMLVLRRPWDVRTKKLKTELTIDEVRRTAGFFTQTASEFGWRICIVDSADEMNRNAANALLKVLEEPPEKSVFFLVSRSPGRLLPTIRSRCRTLKFEPLPPAQTGQIIDQVLAASEDPPPAADQSAALALAQGSAGRALHLIVAGGSDLYATIVSLMPKAGRVDRAGTMALAEQLARAAQNDAYALFRELLSQALSQISKTALTGAVPADVPPALAERILAISSAHPVDRWAGLWEKTNAFLAEVDAVNADRRQAIIKIFLQFESV